VLLRYKGSLHRHGQDYSDKPPSNVANTSPRTTLYGSAPKREMVSLYPFGLLVRQAFPGGAVHFDNQQSVLQLLTTATLPSQPKDSASKNAKPGMPGCGNAGGWGLAPRSGFSNSLAGIRECLRLVIGARTIT
jgi:hypothetical protein